MELALPVGCKGNVNVVSDAASAVYLAHGALLCAIANVNVNLKAIQDAEFVAEWSVKVETVLGKAAALYAEGRNAIAAVMGVPL
jgi:formiminotetrahydrofolate cyclodeaminase